LIALIASTAALDVNRWIFIDDLATMANYYSTTCCFLTSNLLETQ